MILCSSNLHPPIGSAREVVLWLKAKKSIWDLSKQRVESRRPGHHAAYALQGNFCQQWCQPEGIVLTSQHFADTSRGMPHSPGFLGCHEGKTGQGKTGQGKTEQGKTG